MKDKRKCTMESLVSVIIPAYNEVRYIGKAIETLKQQDYDKIEIIIVDDGSTDGTKELLKNMEGITVLEQHHQGTGIARNYGAKIAKGEILVFIDADMYFPREFIGKLVKPILEGRGIGTNHDIEKIGNPENKWARCMGDRSTRCHGQFAIFRAILKEYFDKINGFNPEKGYADDQSLFDKLQIRPVLADDSYCFHNNPSTLKEIYKHERWIGSSYQIKNKKYLFFFGFIFGLPLLIFYSLIKKLLKDFKFEFIIYYPIYSFVKYLGRISGIKSIKSKNTLRKVF